MMTSLKARILTLLFAATISFASVAQESDAEQEISKPQLTLMEVHWWSYFEGPREDVELKVNEFLPELATEVASLQPSNEEDGLGLLAAVRDSFTAYLALLGAEEPKPQVLSEAQDSYTFDDLLVFLGEIGVHHHLAVRSALVFTVKRRACHEAFSPRRPGVGSLTTILDQGP